MISCFGEFPIQLACAPFSVMAAMLALAFSVPLQKGGEGFNCRKGCLDKSGLIRLARPVAAEERLVMHAEEAGGAVSPVRTMSKPDECLTAEQQAGFVGLDLDMIGARFDEVIGVPPVPCAGEDTEMRERVACRLDQLDGLFPIVDRDDQQPCLFRSGRTKKIKPGRVSEIDPLVKAAKDIDLP